MLVAIAFCPAGYVQPMSPPVFCVVPGLQQLIDREPPMVAVLPRQPGQKEGRYAHLLSGEPEILAPVKPMSATFASPALEERVAALEAQLVELKSRLDLVELNTGSKEEDFS